MVHQIKGAATPLFHYLLLLIRIIPPVLSFRKKIAIFVCAPMMGDMLKKSLSEDSL
jgi:hypothetical protein